MTKLPRFFLGEAKATQTLGASAINYTREIGIAERTGAPIGTPAVTNTANDLKHAAVGYTLMMILSLELLSVEEIQRIDDAITARHNEDNEDNE